MVSTLSSVFPATPYVFRSYELPVEAEQHAARIGACTGSSKHLVWQVWQASETHFSTHDDFLMMCITLPCHTQAVRASAAAPYYLDDFSVGEERFQDGAATANNPTLIAIQQVSLGVIGSGVGII